MQWGNTPPPGLLFFPRRGLNRGEAQALPAPALATPATSSQTEATGMLGRTDCTRPQGQPAPGRGGTTARRGEQRRLRRW